MPDALHDYVDDEEEQEAEHHDDGEEQEAEHHDDGEEQEAEHHDDGEEQEAERTGVWAEISALFEHPLYPLRALLTGSQALAQRLATPGRWVVTWVLAGEEGDGKLWRCGVIAGGCWSAYLAVRHIWPEVLAAGGVLWVAAAWAVSPTPHPDNEAPTATTTEPKSEAAVQAAKEAGERLTRTLLKAVDVHTSGGTKGVHLETLAAQLHLSVPALRDHCRRAGIPVRDQLKVRGRNRTGIHRGDVEDLLGTPLHGHASDLTPAQDHGVVYPVDHSPGSPF